MAPFDPFHLLAILRERGLYPIDDALEIMPQRGRVLVVLMLRHVILDLSLRVPIDCRFEILLSDRTALEIIARESVRRAPSFAEISLGIGSPWARIDGISQLLVGEFLARDVETWADSSVSVSIGVASTAFAVQTSEFESDARLGTFVLGVVFH